MAYRYKTNKTWKPSLCSCGNQEIMLPELSCPHVKKKSYTIAADGYQSWREYPTERGWDGWINAYSVTVREEWDVLGCFVKWGNYR